jgi:putative spermidine/putrescine transport system substrate-binding protein
MRVSRVVQTSAVLVATGLLAAACGGGDATSDATSTETAPETTSEETSAGGDLSGNFTFVSFGGAYQDAQTKAMVDPFIAANPGVSVSQDGPTDYAKISQMVASGNVTWDVVDTDPFFPIGTCGTESEPLDFNVIDTTNIIQELISDCSVPSMTYAYVLIYNKDKFGDNPPQNWADFFDTAKFPGKRAIQNAAQGGGYEVALLADGVEPASLYPLDYDRAFKKLESIGDDLIYWETGAQSQEMMENNEVDLILAWNGRAYNAALNGAPIAPMWNQNIVVYDVFMIPMGAPNKDLAMQFINYAIGAEAQGALQSIIPYASINLLAPPVTDDPLLSEYLPTDHIAVGVVQDQQWWSENLDEATKRWTAWTTG